MSYIKNCNICGQRISMRQMSSGQWVAFEVGSNIPHTHDKKTKKKPKNQPKVSLEQFTDRSGEIYSLSKLPKEWLELTPANLEKFLTRIIEKERKVLISYVDKNDDETTREIYPLCIVESNRASQKKIVAYCNLRKDYRVFLFTGITEILAETKIPKTFLNKFESLDEQTKKQILSGNTLYLNQSDVDSDKVIEIKPAVKPRKISQKEEPIFETKDNSEGDSYFSWIVIIVVVIIIVNILD